MAQQVIGGILFSPVPANQLEPGDLFALDAGTAPWRVFYIERESRDVLWVGVTASGVNGSEFGYEVMFNQPVLRAVGAQHGLRRCPVSSGPGEIVDICAGYGGLSMGLSAVTGARVSAYAEIEPAALSILRARHPGAADLGDVTTLEWSRVAGARWFCAGYPCQPFSDAGRRLGTDDPRHIWPWIARGIGVARPDFVLLENVRGHARRGLSEVLADLTELGYGGAWGLFAASDVGAPHQRYRVFVLATRHVAPGFVDVGKPGPAPFISPATGALLPTPRASDGPNGGPNQRGRRGDLAMPSVVHSDAWQFDKYAPAVARWELVTGLTAPSAKIAGARRGERLNPRFVEWMMGLAPGHVVDTIDGSSAQLKALGNGVVWLQAAYAVGTLMRVLTASGASQRPSLAEASR